MTRSSHAGVDAMTEVDSFEAFVRREYRPAWGLGSSGRCKQVGVTMAAPGSRGEGVATHA
jgi:hypothetical protein